MSNPERERTTKLLSAFINFVKFTEQYCDPFLKDLRERSDAIIIQRDNMAEQLSDVKEKIDEIKYVIRSSFVSLSSIRSRSRIEKEKPVLEKLNAENAALTNIMFATKDAQGKAVRDVEQYKAERNAILKRKVSFV